MLIEIAGNRPNFEDFHEERIKKWTMIFRSRGY